MALSAMYDMLRLQQVNARESGTACYGLHMAEILMLKLPDVFRVYFLKEGVVHAMEQAAAKAGSLSGPTSPAPAAGSGSGAAGGSGGAGSEPASKGKGGGRCTWDR
jgi:E3 ubiquitin-protein ligase TRIP12